MCGATATLLQTSIAYKARQERMPRCRHKGGPPTIVKCGDGHSQGMMAQAVYPILDTEERTMKSTTDRKGPFGRSARGVAAGSTIGCASRAVRVDAAS
jgi:hypothetical protein